MTEEPVTSPPNTPLVPGNFIKSAQAMFRRYKTWLNEHKVIPLFLYSVIPFSLCLSLTLP